MEGNSNGRDFPIPNSTKIMEQSFTPEELQNLQLEKDQFIETCQYSEVIANQIIVSNTNEHLRYSQSRKSNEYGHYHSQQPLEKLTGQDEQIWQGKWDDPSPKNDYYASQSYQVPTGYPFFDYQSNSIEETWESIRKSDFEGFVNLETTEFHRSFIPNSEDVYTRQPKSGKIIRYVFEGNTQFQDIEIEIIKSIRMIIAGQITLTNPEIAPFIQTQSDSLLLRYYYACCEKMEQTISSLITGVQAKTDLQSNPKMMTQMCLEMLNEGGAYIFGRDKALRPIFVQELNKLLKIQNKRGTEGLQHMFIIQLKYLEDRVYINGRVESYILFYNFEGIGLGNFSQTLKIFDMLDLDKSYKTRSNKIYWFNHGVVAPYIANAWNKNDERWSFKTKKIKGKQDNKEMGMWDHININQLEKKFGGSVENLEKNWWPPKCANSHFF